MLNMQCLSVFSVVTTLFCFPNTYFPGSPEITLLSFVMYVLCCSQATPGRVSSARMSTNRSIYSAKYVGGSRTRTQTAMMLSVRHPSRYLMSLCGDVSINCVTVLIGVEIGVLGVPEICQRDVCFTM